MKVYLVKDNTNRFCPAYNSDHELVSKIKEGEMILCEIKKPRSIGHHRKFFTLIEMVFQNQEVYTNKDLLREDLTIEAGFYERYYNFWGEEKIKAKSISFAEMGQTEFEEFYRRFLDTVIKIYGIEDENLEETIERYYS